MSPFIVVHLTAALVALPLWLVVLLRPKGTLRHRTLGRMWAVAMLIAAISSFWVRGIAADGGLSWIHLLSVLTLVSLSVGIWAIRTGRQRRHRGFMIGAYLGLVGAGIGATMPGRIVGDFLAGLF